MLQAMRKHAKYFYVLFFIVILSFIFWGVGTVDKTEKNAIVAEVGKYKITTDDYWKTYDNVSRYYKDVYKDKFDEEMEKKMNLKENVLNMLINERLLLVAAKDSGIGVSDEELQESIMQEQAFMKDGVFNKDVYLSRLRLIRMTPEEYESIKRQELIAQKMKRLIEVSADITDMESDLQKIGGNEQLLKMLKQKLLEDKKDKTIKSYVDGLKKEVNIRVNKEAISL
jgi:hypothetical protein